MRLSLSANPLSGLPVWLLAALLLAAPVSAKDKDKSKVEKAQAEDAGDLEPFAAGHPTIALEGLRCQVHRDGVLREDISAEAGRYDEKADVLDLARLNVLFLDEGTTAGQASCGKGRVWTKARPKQGIGAQDMLLERTVRLRTNNNYLLETPAMRYDSLRSLLRSDNGFVKQLKMENGYVVGQGRRFEIKLTPEKNTFESWKEYDAEMRKSDKPVLEP